MKATHILSAVAVAALVLAGCTTRYEPYERQGNGTPNGGRDTGGDPTPTPTAQLTERTDWKVAYVGRADYQEADGSISRVEEFQFNYTGDNYFILRTFTDDDFANYYKGDIKAMLEGEVQDIVTIAQNQELDYADMGGMVFTRNIKTLYADLILHGNYTAYLIEFTAAGKPTYNYAKTAMEVQEERPMDAYLQWLGSWKIGDGTTYYEILVSQAEANYLYYIDGWETGQNVAEQMNMERDWVFARFRQGILSFYGQYLMSYEDESLQDSNGKPVWVDEMFVGTYLTSSSDVNGEVDGEGADAGYDIAYTFIGEDGSVLLVPEEFDFDNGFHAVYHSMRYSRFCYDEYNWAHYNVSGVPSFKEGFMTMDKMLATKAPVEHVRTREMVRRTQPKAHVVRKVRSERQAVQRQLRPLA